MNTVALPFWKRFFQWKSLGIAVLVLAALALTAIVAASYLALHITKLNAQHTTIQLAMQPVLQTIELVRAKQLIYKIDHGRYATSLKEIDPNRSFNTSDYFFETSSTSKGYTIKASPAPTLTRRMDDLKSWGGNFIAPIFYTDETGEITSPTATITSTKTSK